MAENVGSTPRVPQLTKRQTQRCNVPATDPEEYFRRSVTVPLIDHILQEMNSRL